MEQVLTLRSRHFKNAVFLDVKNCPVARSAREHFNENDIVESVVYLYVGRKKYSHKQYTLGLYWIDSLKAFFTPDNTKLRTIQLNEV